MNHKTRQMVFDKYNGLCAYTGKPLDDKWQIDHIIPRHLAHFMLYSNKNVDDIENLNPALRIVNHYKRGFDIEGFRNLLLTFHKRLAKVPKHPYSPTGIKRKAYMLSVANAFGITPDKPFSGMFYFETIGL